MPHFCGFVTWSMQMFLAFFATAALAVLTVLMRRRPTVKHSLKAVVLSLLDIAMVILTVVCIDLMFQHIGIDGGLIPKAFFYLVASGCLMFVGWSLRTILLAVVHWHRRRHEGGEHFDFG